MSECNYDNQSLIDQRQKVIQNVVRVSSSEYSMNLASNIVYDSNSINTNLGLADRSSNVGTQKQQVKKEKYWLKQLVKHILMLHSIILLFL